MTGSASGSGAKDVMNFIASTQTLVDSFHTLADEVQTLTDRNTILEHKLRFAHEQYQYLADKHAPAAPEILETLAKLQLPPDLHHTSLEEHKTVPLPKRNAKLDARNQIAVIIRDGRRCAQHLAALVEPSKTSASSRGSVSREAHSGTSMSTALEQDFTVAGKKGQLQCPFSAAATPAPVQEDGVDGMLHVHRPEEEDHTPHHSKDPICAAMYEETTSHSHPSANGSNVKCPIRFMDQHSPEEIAHYVETHKHELPRSHAVCVSRYQKNEDQIRKLDAKYGNLVSMIQGLSNLHKPMLPLGQEEQGQQQHELEKASNERVENWAQAVTSSATGVEADAAGSVNELIAPEERESHFDRPMKEVRVGESPSRPWGISVPVYQPDTVNGDGGPPLSPPPAPVVMPSTQDQHNTGPSQAPRGKCPFDHTKLAAMKAMGSPMATKSAQEKLSPRPDHTMPAFQRPSPESKADEEQRPATRPPPPPFTLPHQPAFINPPAEPTQQPASSTPQMVFTGPVFIGYPMEQAIQFMQHYQPRQ